MLASSVLGSGVAASNEEMRFLHYRPEVENPDAAETAEWVRRIVDSHVRQGKSLDYTKAMEKLTPLADVFMKTRMPYFRTMGATL